MSDPTLNEAAKKPKQLQIKHNINLQKELYAVGSERGADGENDLAEHVTRFAKRLNDIIASA